MNEDVWPKYWVEYDSFHNEYDVKYSYSKEGKEYLLESYYLEWSAVRRAKRAIKVDEKKRNRTQTVVWGPYP